MNLEIFLDKSIYKNRFTHQKLCFGPKSDVDNENFWLIFRGQFGQKTQKSIFRQNQWKLLNIKKAIVVKNVIYQKCFLQDQFLINFEEVIT